MSIDAISFFSAEACKSLSIAFANAVDQRDYDRAVRVFCSDAVFARWDQAFSGRDAIEAMLHNRDESVQTRHVCTNIEVTDITVTTAKGITYFTFFNGEGELDEVIPLAGPKFVGEYHDDYIMQSGEWLIHKRSVKIVFGDIG